MTSTARTIALGALLLAAALFFAPRLASQAAAQSGIEQILAYDVNIEILPDGDLLVTEIIDYDFGGRERRGIFRDIPVRSHYDDTYDRVLRIQDLLVTTTPGAPDDVKLSTEGEMPRIRIGDPDVTISGQHIYRIEYRVEGGVERVRRSRGAVLERGRPRLGRSRVE